MKSALEAVHKAVDAEIGGSDSATVDSTDNIESKLAIDVDFSDFTDRSDVYKYIPRNDYLHLESCAQRIYQMDKNSEETLHEFLRFFFHNTILDLQYERGGFLDDCILPIIPVVSKHFWP